MPKVSYKAMNELFIEKTASEESTQKAAEAYLPMLQTHVREGCLQNQVWEMTPKPEDRVQRNPKAPDQFYVLDDIEPDFVAMAMNSQGMPESRFYAAEACQTFFYPIRSKELLLSTDKIRTLPYSVEEHFKKTIGNEVARQRDVRYNANLTLAATAASQVLNVTSAGPRYKDIVAGADQIDGNIFSEIFCTDIIMHYSFLNKLKQAGPQDFDIGSWEVYTDGYTRTTIDGRRIHLTRKKEFDKNKVFFVTEKKYVATNYEDYALKFQAKKEMDEISLKAKASVGDLIYNVYGVAVLNWTKA